MKKRWIRFTCWLISVLMMLSLLGGCSGKKTELIIAARTEVITYFNDNGLTDYFENKANVQIKWMDYGSENVYERVYADIGKAQGDLPDAYLGMGLYDNEMEIVAGDLFIELTNVLESTTELKRVITEDESRKGDMYINGGLYSYPSFYEDFANEFPQKAWINTQWLEKMQVEKPTTTEQLQAVLQLFKNNDPNGNGEVDEIPLGVAYQGGKSSTLGFIINSFLPTAFDLSDNTEYLNVDSTGNVYAGVVDDRFKEALLYVRQLVEEELVNQDFFTAAASDLGEGRAEAEKYGIIVTADIRTLFTDEARLANYEPLAPLKTEESLADEAISFSSLTKVQTGGYMLAKNTEKTEAALAFGDAMLEESGTLTILYGAENTGWSKADGRITAMGGGATTWKLLDANKKGIMPLSNLKGAIPYWYSAPVQMSQQADVAENDTVAELKTNTNWAGYLNQVTAEIYELPGRRYSQYVLPELIFTAEQEKSLWDGGNTRAEVYEYLTEACRQFVTGEKDIEEEWDDYVATLNDKGLQTMLEITQEAYTKFTHGG